MAVSPCAPLRLELKDFDFPVSILAFAKPSSPVKAQAIDRMVPACQGVAARKEDLKFRGDFEEAPQIEHGE